VLDAAAAELRWADGQYGPVLSPAVAALDGGWGPDPRGVPLDAVQTIAAVVTVVRRAVEDGLALADAIVHAISWGGDTDTVAAIAAGILGCGADASDLPWFPRLALPPAEVLDGASAALAALREAIE
jgi:hypothetical protein